MGKYRTQPPVDFGEHALIARRNVARHELKLDENADQALLSAIVQISLDASAFSIGGRNDPTLRSLKVSQPRRGRCRELRIAKCQFGGWSQASQELRLVSTARWL